jgi:hypothetical protein
MSMDEFDFDGGDAPSSLVRDEFDFDGGDGLSSATSSKRLSGCCSLCLGKDGFRGMMLQQCRDCGVLYHSECYSRSVSEHNDPCWACQAVGTTVKGRTLEGKLCKVSIKERPTECCLCSVATDTPQTMHPVYDGPGGKQLVDEHGKAVFCHTLCAYFINSYSDTRECVYGETTMDDDSIHYFVCALNQNPKHQKLRCSICGKDDRPGAVLRIPIQCSANSNEEYPEFKACHSSTSSCRETMHVGCAMWGALNLRRVFFYPGNETQDLVANAYCQVHAQDLKTHGAANTSVEESTMQSSQRTSLSSSQSFLQSNASSLLSSQSSCSVATGGNFSGQLGGRTRTQRMRVKVLEEERSEEEPSKKRRPKAVRSTSSNASPGSSRNSSAQSAPARKRPRQLTTEQTTPQPQQRVRMVNGTISIPDAGNVRMLLDEAAFLCTSIQSMSHSNAYKAAIDLGNMLSDRKNRKIMIAQGNMVKALLRVIAFATTLCLEVDSLSKNRRLLDAIAILLHFLSLDCTLSEHASSKTHAYKLKTTFLANPQAMQGILHLVLVDETTATLGGKQAGVLARSISGDIAMKDTPSAASSSCASPIDASPASTGSADSASSTDPTAAGRKRRRRKRDQQLERIPEDSAALQFGAEDEEKERSDSLGLLVDTVTTRVLRTMHQEDETLQHTCTNDKNEKLESIPLLALARIISGKAEGMDESCMDSLLDDSDNDTPNEETNPLLLTNHLVGKSGAAPLLSHALTDTLVAVTKQLRRKRPCGGCLLWLSRRVHRLVSIVDGAALLNDANRELFCQEGYNDELGGPLIISLVSMLQKLMDKGKLLGGVWGDIGLEVIRTVTSLTHENNVAATELTRTLNDGDDDACCLDILANVLQFCANNTGVDCPKVRYDSITFCLNALANVVESSNGEAREILANLSNGEFLQWLVQWLVDQTKSFRGAVVESSSGNKLLDGHLEAHENENLVTSGNGFVLLACLMINDDDTCKIRDVILSGLPGPSNTAKIDFVKNVLSAFCNFYHYSIGDLSMAVVAPVKELIRKLENIQSLV